MDFVYIKCRKSIRQYDKDYVPDKTALSMVDNRMNAFLSQYFEIEFHPRKGIVKTPVA